MSKFLSNNNDKFKCYSILSSICKKNNFLAPHRDGIANKNLDKKVFNFIYFIDGNNSIPELSGATRVYLRIIILKNQFLYQKILRIHV